jgi:hypothetical protein
MPAKSMCMLLFLCGCAHDFGEFEPIDDGGATSDVADGHTEKQKADAASVPDAPMKDAVTEGPCRPSQSCLDTAMSCGDACTEAKASCEAACGGRTYCTEHCDMKAMGCADECVSACTSCTETAGCAGGEVCQSAAGGGE